VGAALIILASGCSAPKAPTRAASGSSIPTYEGPQTSFCSTPISYTGTTVTITGGAQYKAWTSSGSGLTTPVLTNPIRRAEVRVTNSNGVAVQCAETDGSGNFSFVVPQSSSQLTVSVIARANNSYVRAYIYDDPRYNNLYSISATFTPSSSQSVGTLSASHLGSVVGGAFNILDQFLNANEYLRSKVGSCSGTFAGCSNFTVTPLVTAYWKLGFNPGEYYSTGPLSYYLPGYSRLFILGGESGDYNSSDTDHFDNSVILHEFGHFIEDVMAVSDSPGGSHNGNKVIDPRLAWSEGWGNFFQAAVRGSADYIDTYGNPSGSTNAYFDVDLENQSVSYDTPIYSGEGNFREFSVTRLLWDAIDITPSEASSTDNINDRFIEIWHSLTASDYWMKATAAFRAMGLIHEKQTTLPTTSWSGIRSIEKHQGSTTDYAQYVTTSGACTYSMTPTDVSGYPFFDNGSFSTSHWGLNNDFYYLRVPSALSATVEFRYWDADGSGSEADIDFYIYNESARYGTSEDIVGYNESEPDYSAATAETASLSGTVPAGKYLLNVKAYTGGAIGGAIYYTLKINGSFLCPAALP